MTGFLEHLELMSPWEYQEVRRVLGHGSGFDSPGFREIRRVSPPLLDAFHALRRERGLSLLEVYTRGREHEDLYQLAEALTEWDEKRRRLALPPLQGRRRASSARTSSARRARRSSCSPG